MHAFMHELGNYSSIMAHTDNVIHDNSSCSSLPVIMNSMPSWPRTYTHLDLRNTNHSNTKACIKPAEKCSTWLCCWFKRYFRSLFNIASPAHPTIRTQSALKAASLKHPPSSMNTIDASNASHCICSSNSERS